MKHLFLSLLLLFSLISCSKEYVEPVKKTNCILQLYHEYTGNFSYKVKTDTSIWFHSVDDKFLALWKSYPVFDTVCLNLVTENVFFDNHKH